MKGLLLYNLPEEQEEFELAQNGAKYKYALDEVSAKIRNRLKHEELSLEVHEALAEVMQWIRDEKE